MSDTVQRVQARARSWPVQASSPVGEHSHSSCSSSQGSLKPMDGSIAHLCKEARTRRQVKILEQVGMMPLHVAKGVAGRARGTSIVS